MNFAEYNVKDANLEEILLALKSLDTVEAVALGGSRSTGASDENSDYDIYVYCINIPIESVNFTVDYVNGSTVIHNRVVLALPIMIAEFCNRTVFSDEIFRGVVVFIRWIKGGWRGKRVVLEDKTSPTETAEVTA